MSERRPSLLIKDMLQCIAHIELYTANYSFEAFAGNFMAVEACLYNIQIIGETVSRLPDTVKATETTIPWTLIKGMQNRLIHEYFGTDIRLVWQVIKNDLPSFKGELNKIYTSLTDQKN